MVVNNNPSKFSILVIDDDRNTRELINAALEDDYIVTVVDSGIKALALLKDFTPDLILLDQRMPEMDGLMTWDAIKKMNKDLKCIMVTAEGSIQLAVTAIKEGAMDFIQKPFDLFLLKYTIDKALKEIKLINERKAIEKERERIQAELEQYKNHLEELVEQRTKEANKAKVKAEEANRAKSIFLANMSHELRTPMHGILSFAKFGLERESDSNPEKLKEYFIEIRSCGERLLRLVNDLLDLSKLEGARFDYHLSKCKFSDIVSRAIKEIEGLVLERGAVIKFFPPDFDDSIYVDQQRMIQVIHNLLINAIKYSEQEKEVDVGISLKNGEVFLTVKDKGIGIPDDELEGIFDPFVQSSRSRNNSGGVGLGLSIARQIVNDFQGRIWAENNPDKGAKISLVVPYSNGSLDNK